MRQETNVNINFNSIVNSTYTWEANMHLTDDHFRHRTSLDIPTEVINVQNISARVQGKNSLISIIENLKDLDVAIFYKIIRNRNP